MTVSATGTFSDKNVGTGKAVTLSETYAGTDRDNYTITGQGSTTADITVKTITTSGLSASNKVYNGNTAASLTGTAVLTNGAAADNDNQYYTADTVSLTGTASGAFADKNVGTGKAVTISGLSLTGTDAANYSLSISSSSADITVKTITYDIAAGNITYGAADSAGSISYSALETGDVVSAIAQIDDRALSTAGKLEAGTYTQSINGTHAGVDKDNYTITLGTANSYVVGKQAITVTNISASDKEYNGNTAATIDVSLASFTDLVDGDTVTVSATGTFSDKNVDTGKTVTLSETYAGTDRNNYTITSQGSTTADITQLASVTWTGSAGNGLWSSATNWAGSAIPDLDNVAQAIIPEGVSTTFDTDSVTTNSDGSIGSSIVNAGTLTFSGASDYTFAQQISGAGDLS